MWVCPGGPFIRHFGVTGYDIRKSRIAELKQGHDRTLEVSGETLKKAS